MKGLLFVIYVLLFSLGSLGCITQQYIQYELYSNGNKIFTIKPDDIEFYDTTQSREFIEIHEMRLKKGFYEQDSFVLSPPLTMICKVKGEKYFWADFFQMKQSQPRLCVNFKFRSLCKNVWTFQDQEPERLILRPAKECNSIEFFHMKTEIEGSRESYYEKKAYFQNYVDTARLAHEILLDPYYINALTESGVSIKSAPKRD